MCIKNPNSCGIAPKYSTGCTAASGQNGWYCNEIAACYSSSAACETACVGSVCVSEPWSCPPASGEVPKYNTNCNGCISLAGGAYCSQMADLLDVGRDVQPNVPRCVHHEYESMPLVKLGV